MENWKPAPAFEGWYEVSDKGRVRRARPGKATYVGKLLKPYTRRSGHQTVCLQKDGVSKQAEIHRLVAGAFIGPCPPRKEVNHIDGRPANNAVKNLEYVTRSENVTHAYRMGLLQPVRGEASGSAKLTDHDIRLIRRSPLGTYALSIHYQVATVTIKRIRNGTIWKHVT